MFLTYVMLIFTFKFLEISSIVNDVLIDDLPRTLFNGKACFVI